jgi:hypothetical protein
MNGRDILLVLAHLFRMKGGYVTIASAIDFLSFSCRYGLPSEIRKLLSTAMNNEMISREGNSIKAEFLFDKQKLPLNLSTALRGKVSFTEDVQPLR